MKPSGQTILVVGAALLAVAASVVAIYLSRSSTPAEQPVAQQSRIISAQRVAAETIDSASSFQPKRSGAKANVDSADWGTRFRESRDYFEFVSSAAEAAMAGDGRAAHYVDVALTNCAQIIDLAKTSQDPEKQYLENYTRTFPFAPHRLIDNATSEARKCIRLGKENAFGDLPSREGGYSKNFWHDLALVEKDPLAQALQVQTDLPKLSQMKSDEARRLALDRLRQYARDAVGSKDPDALFAIGIALKSGDMIDNDDLKPLAVSLAACDLGYDCSANNLQNYRQICRPLLTCPDGTLYSDRLQQIYGATRYAEIYSQAQVFKDLMAREDWPELDKFVRIEVRPIDR